MTLFHVAMQQIFDTCFSDYTTDIPTTANDALPALNYSGAFYGL